jgi:HD-GYP domain-containing protein (c-di-GMP phosphodiesterase class II)
MKRDDAFAELERNRGTQFDPAVVAALIRLERARPAAAADPIAIQPPGLEDGRPLAA